MRLFRFEVDVQHHLGANRALVSVKEKPFNPVVSADFNCRVGSAVCDNAAIFTNTVVEAFHIGSHGPRQVLTESYPIAVDAQYGSPVILEFRREERHHYIVGADSVVVDRKEMMTVLKGIDDLGS
ncbi:MAG: hypothetical protein EXQ58_00415 [Acidobacteria bacterium]|nr:hypothetical protein [Acidobacteriota bacterium]